LENLRHCLPPSVRRTLDELPESLDGTYERVLREIKKPNRDHALRLLECLVVAVRPLHVEELAEVLAVDFEAAEGMPKLNASWRWKDQEQALLLSCSSLISIVDGNNNNNNNYDDYNDDYDNYDNNDNNYYYDYNDDYDDYNNNDNNYYYGYNDDYDDYNNNNNNNKNDRDPYLRAVQFSHFSVKEFLTSPRLATPNRDVSYYHIDLEAAHTIMAQACLSVLLRSDVHVDDDGIRGSSPLAKYAAEHWATHAQFKNVSSYLRHPMECLFDVDRPYFASWLKLHDIDTPPPFESPFCSITRPTWKPPAGPIYYAALCGFRDLTEHLIAKNPQGVKASGGYYMTSCVAALAGRYFQLAHLLHCNGSSVNFRGHFCGNAPLHSASYHGGYLNIICILLEYGADINAQNNVGATPLRWATFSRNPELVCVLLEQGADPNISMHNGTTPLHRAVEMGSTQIVRLLLQRGADVDVVDEGGKTALRYAQEGGYNEIETLLLAHAADVSS